MSSATKDVIAAEPNQCTAREKLGHAVGVLGHDSMYTLWSLWMVPFMTDILMLPAAFMGILLAVVRVFDGITDVAMGFVADRTRSRFGRYRPWVLRSGPLMAVCVILSFFVPSQNMVTKCVFAGIMYFVTGSLVFTSVDIPFWSLPAAMTSNTKERGDIVAFTTTASNLISGIINTFAPLALAFFGGALIPGSYFKVAVIVAIWGATMYLICFSQVREHVQPDPQQKFSIKAGLKNIYQNKPLVCLQIANICCLLAMVLKGAFNYYYCMYNLGDTDLRYMAVLGAISTVGMVVGALIFPIISRLIGKKNTMFALAGIFLASSLVLYFSGWSNVMVVFCTAAVNTLCIGAAIVCVNAMMMDTIEYGEWKTGQRNEGIITATRCFVTKLVMAFVGIIIATVMGLTGYTGGAVQSAQTLNAFHTVISLGCGACMICAVIPMFFYTLTEKRHAEIMVELAARKASKHDKDEQ